MADPVLSFSPKVKEIVDDAMQNKTKIVMLRPDFLPDPKRTEPYTKYDQSEFYQLRIACVKGTVDQAAGVYGIKKEEAGRVCDAVLVKAADQMAKGVAIDDPTNLLAPYYVSQQNRGYTSADGAPVDVAILGARLAANLNSNSTSAEDKPLMYDLRKAFKPELMPKNAPAEQPVLLASLKGGAKDAAFTSQAAYALAKNGAELFDGSGFFPPAVSILESGAECNLKNTQQTRQRCTSIGYGLAHRYRDAKVAANSK